LRADAFWPGDAGGFGGGDVGARIAAAGCVAVGGVAAGCVSEECVAAGVAARGAGGEGSLAPSSNVPKALAWRCGPAISTLLRGPWPARAWSTALNSDATLDTGNPSAIDPSRSVQSAGHRGATPQPVIRQRLGVDWGAVL
jgi:hypothetical protein